MGGEAPRNVVALQTNICVVFKTLNMPCLAVMATHMKIVYTFSGTVKVTKSVNMTPTICLEDYDLTASSPGKMGNSVRFGGLVYNPRQLARKQPGLRNPSLSYTRLQIIIYLADHGYLLLLERWRSNIHSLPRCLTAVWPLNPRTNGVFQTSTTSDTR